MKKKHLLIVDDDERIRKLLKQFLSKSGYRVSTAGSATGTHANGNSNSKHKAITSNPIKNATASSKVSACVAKGR